MIQRKWLNPMPLETEILKKMARTNAARNRDPKKKAKINAARNRDPTKMAKSNAARNRDPKKKAKINAARNRDPQKMAKTNAARSGRRKKEDASVSDDIRDYDLNSANQLPTDDMLAQYTKHPKMARSLFWLMGGHPTDWREPPCNLVTHQTTVAEDITEFDRVMGQEVAIRVCATCGKRAPMPEGEFRLMSPEH